MNVNFEKLAIDVGYSYLNGGSGYWEDGGGKVHSFDSMSNDYLDNCIKFVEKGIKEIENKKYGITSDIKKSLSKIYKDPSEDDINHAMKQILKILKSKKKELKEYKKERESYKMKQ